MSEIERNQAQRGYRQRRGRLARLIGAALAAALLALMAQLTLPIGPVPITLQTFSVTLIAAALPLTTALLSIVAYIALGLIGMPVFAGFKGGLPVLLGPTGGYIWGFFLQILLLGGILALLERSYQSRQGLLTAAGLAGGFLGLAACYLTGTLQLAFVLKLDFSAALAVGVIPFILKDLLSVAVAVPTGLVIRRALTAAGLRR